MKGLIKLIVMLAFVFFVSALFKGGDYVRLISNKTGINLNSAANIADTFRIDRFMDEKKRERADREKGLTGN